MVFDAKENKRAADLMHERAREAGSELRRTLIGLASGSIGLMLVVFVSTDRLDYSLVQLLLVGAAVLSHTVTILFGLLAWRSDAQRNYFWALALDPIDSENENKNHPVRKKYQMRMDRSDKITRYMFIVGVLLIAIFVLIRLKHLM